MSWHPVEHSGETGWRRSVENAEALVVVLHGYGKSGENIKQRLAEPLSRQLPQVAFFAPDGFEPWEGEGAPGRQWFSRKDITPELRLRRVQALYPRLLALIERELAATGVPAERLVLAGFSQGAILSLHHAAVSTQRNARVLAYAGRLASVPQTNAAATPISLIYGSADAGGEGAGADADRLRAAGHPVDLHLLDGVGHDISAAGIALGIDAIRRSLPLAEALAG
ncbi:MAG: dienelactone hydrolase family protein [Burkholderiaceae bacterium]